MSERIPQGLKFPVCVAGIWSCFFVYGILQEGIYLYRSPEGGKFEQTMVLLLAEHSMSALVAYVMLAFGLHSDQPWLPFLRSQGLIACAQCGAKFASNEALKSVSYPIQALAKSSKTLPAMLGCFWSGKHISRIQWAAAVGITGGTAYFSTSGKKHGTVAASTVGVCLLVVSLLCDGTVSAAQEGLRKNKKQLTPYEQMFMTNAGAALLLLPCAVVSGHLSSGIVFLAANFSIIDEIVIFALCSAIGQVFIFLAITWFGPDVNAKVTTVRKMATVLLSILWYGHPMSGQQWLGVAVVFSSVLVEVAEKMLSKPKAHS